MLLHCRQAKSACKSPVSRTEGCAPTLWLHQNCTGTAVLIYKFVFCIQVLRNFLSVIKDYSQQLPVFNEEVWLSAHLLKIIWISFVRAFTYLQQAPLRIVMSARLSLCIYQRGFHWTDFREILYWEIKKKSFEKLEIWFNLDQNTGQFT